MDAKLLYDAWAAASEIVPQVNRSVWSPTDGAFAPEGCMARQGFLTVDDYHFARDPMSGSGIHSVTEWAEAILAGKKLDGITPLQVADNLDGYAARALKALPALRAKMGGNVELQETLKDIESMSYLGRYYADKMRGAAKLAVFRQDRQRKQFNAEAVAHFKDAVKDWKAYAAICSSQYKTQVLARTDVLGLERHSGGSGKGGPLPRSGKGTIRTSGLQTRRMVRIFRRNPSFGWRWRRRTGMAFGR